MNSAKPKGTSKKIRSDRKLKVDEDFKINDDLRIDDRISVSNSQMAVPKKQRTFKPTAAGYLLLISFLLNLLLPMTIFYFIYSAENDTGNTSLIGEVLDEDEMPVANVTVEIIDTNYTILTDVHGKFSFKEVPVGTYDVKFTKNGFRTIKIRKLLYSKNLLKTLDQTDNIIEIPGEIQNIYVEPFDGPYFEDRIIDDDLNNTIFGFITNETGIHQANFQIMVLNTNIKTTTDSDGKYILNNITPGIVKLQVSENGVSNNTVITFLFASNKSQTLNITYYEKDMNLDLTKGKVGKIQGRAVDEDLNPIESAQIILNLSNNPDIKSYTISNSNGEYSFSDVPIGIYTVTILATDYFITHQINVTVHNGSIIALPDTELKNLDEPLEIIEEIAGTETYSCIIVLIILSLITFAGAISAFQRKRYGLAFMGAFTGMIPFLLIVTVYTIGAIVVSIIGLVLLVFSREEFAFKPV